MDLIILVWHSETFIVIITKTWDLFKEKHRQYINAVMVITSQNPVARIHGFSGKFSSFLKNEKFNLIKSFV